MSEAICHVVVRGQVQGVGYRAFVEDEAALRGLEGWVRNRRDGSVEALFSGPAEEVEEMIEACRKGPWSAKVEGVDQRKGTPEQLAQRRLAEKFSVLGTI
jgi:acylphosphatase